jgi:hypothetical protein
VGLAIGMAAGSAAAVGLSNVMTTGTNIAYFELDPTDCTTMKATSTPSDLDPIVQGTSATCAPNSCLNRKLLSSEITKCYNLLPWSKITMVCRKPEAGPLVTR